ncbi:MAG: hypothetical protein U0103_10345 [Candidatus Obscuribacterales bacterium]
MSQPLNAPSHSTLHKPGNHSLVAAGLVASTCLLFLPVILMPHWGQFDDSSLILACGRRLLDDPTFRSFLISSGGTRVGIFLWTSALWPFFANNPAGYYAVNLLIVSITMVLLYAISYKLTKSIGVSAFSSALLLTASGLFEVIYTLDKQELFLPLLFAVVVLSHFISLDCKKFTLAAVSILSLLSAIASYYTKECGAILCLFSGTFFIATLFSVAKESRIAVMLKVGTLSVVTVVPFVLIRGISPLSNGYIQLNFAPVVLSKKFVNLFAVDPIFIMLSFFILVSWLILSFNKGVNKLTQPWRAFSALVVSTWAAICALLCYDSGELVLLYIWFPVYVFLLPAFACSLQQLSRVFPKAFVVRTMLGIIFVSAIAQLPTRAVQAQFQFQMDALLAALVDKLADKTMASKTLTLAGMAVFDISATEVPENIECFVRSKFVPDYYDREDERTQQYQFSMLNFLSDEEQPPHLPSDPPGVYRMKQFRGIRLEYTTEFPSGYVGWSGFQILARSGGASHWVRRPFTVGNLLIVPYGDVRPNAVLYRGSGMFSAPWQAQILRFAQLTLKEVGYVERKIVVLGGHRLTLGWRILQVSSAEPLSANLNANGVLDSGQPIYYRFDPAKPKLRVISVGRVQGPISCTFFDGSLTSVPDSGSSSFEVSLRGTRSSDTSGWVKIYNPAGKIQIKRMELAAE